MDPIFLFKIFLSFFVGSIWVTLATVAGEKYGTKRGGLIAGLPSTSIITLFFIGWTQSPSVAVEATTISPLIGAITVGFLLLYIYLLKRGFSVAIVSSFAVWIILSSIFVVTDFNNLYISITVYIAAVLMAYFVLDRVLKIKSSRSKKVEYSSRGLLFRGLFSGFIMASGVYLANIGGPLMGGVFAMFPATFIGTLLVSYFVNGSSFSSAMMKSSIFSGISVVVYTISVFHTYNWLGLWMGTVVSLIVSLLSAVMIYKFVLKKMK